MIVDKITVYFRSGKGGEGSSSLMRKSLRKAVGAGGDGGRGGDIILKISPHLYDLSKFKGNKKIIAPDGQRGRERNKKGKDAEPLIVYVPSGTRLIDIDKGEIIVDLIGERSEFLICRGGRGGKGNYRRDYTLPPGQGEEKEVILDYRIPNDIAILGFANSGKTTLFNALTGQNQKVAAYPFTTRSCIWAESEYGSKRGIVLDTPPLKRRKGPGQHRENTFLDHIFRSKIILFLSDNPSGYQKDFKELREEIALYDRSLLEGKKFFYLLNKIDTIDRKVVDKGIMTLSAREGLGVEEVKSKIFESL